MALAETAASLASSFSMAEAIALLKPLALFIAGVVVYSVFIFKFYRFIAKKDLFEINMDKYNRAKHKLLRKMVDWILYVVKYAFLFPVFLFFWFITFTVLLVFLSSNNVQTVLLMSMALIVAVRVTSYYNEDLSKDLAKMLPFALLGVFLVDVSYFDVSSSIELAKSMPAMTKTMAYYLVFVILLEFFLRIISGIFRMIKPKEKLIKEEESQG